MNKVGTINVEDMLKINFKHIFTYTALFHVIAYLNDITYTIKLTASAFIIRYNCSKSSAENALKELLDYKIITPYDKENKIYKVNRYYIYEVNNINDYGKERINKANIG